MSYSTIEQCAGDTALQGRVNACIAQEQLAKGDPADPGRVDLMWAIASAADIEAAYASALAAGNPDPGGDESVITDQMILSTVQTHWPTA